MGEAAHISSVPQQATASVLGSPEDNLSIATHDGQLSGGTYHDWLEAMRLRQTFQKQIQEWVGVIADLGKACQDWMAINQEWVREIAVRFNAEPAAVSLYVVVKDQDGVTLEHRRDVADMGLVLCGAFGVRAEARITSARPAGYTFMVE